MKLTLLGTGSASGWPNPFCTCASCAAVRGTAEVRGQTSVLVDDALLLDCGPDAPRAAARLGVPLAGVRAILLTHAHPDHCGPAALLWRGWTSLSSTVEVVGPPAAIAACRDWVGPDEPVRFVEVRAGERLAVAGYDVRVLPAAHGEADLGPAVLYDVTGPDGARVLYATDTGPPPADFFAATAGAAYDAVLMEETNGDNPGLASVHLSLATFPLVVAELRRSGAVTAATRVLAVHLGHGNPPPAELARRLAPWGVEVPRDGDVLVLPGGLTPAVAARRPYRVLVLGGARSGKSVEAERRLAAEPAVTYVATGLDRGGDAEWSDRIRRHRERRPDQWRTVETTDLQAVLRDSAGPLLVDCISLWLGSVLDEPDLGERCDGLVDAWRGTGAYVVAVSNEVGSGVVPASPSGRRFRDELGRLNARLARTADEVWLVTAGIARRLA